MGRQGQAPQGPSCPHCAPSWPHGSASPFALGLRGCYGVSPSLGFLICKVKVTIMLFFQDCHHKVPQMNGIIQGPPTPRQEPGNKQSWPELCSLSPHPIHSGWAKLTSAPPSISPAPPTPSSKKPSVGPKRLGTTGINKEMCPLTVQKACSLTSR